MFLSSLQCRSLPDNNLTSVFICVPAPAITDVAILLVALYSTPGHGNRHCLCFVIAAVCRLFALAFLNERWGGTWATGRAPPLVCNLFPQRRHDRYNNKYLGRWHISTSQACLIFRSFFKIDFQVITSVAKETPTSTSDMI